MIGLGTIINAAAIIVGGIFGALFGKFIPQRLRETLQLGCGVSVMFVAISGAMEKMLTVSGDGLAGRWGLYTVLCIALGGIVGVCLCPGHLSGKNSASSDDAAAHMLRGLSIEPDAVALGCDFDGIGDDTPVDLPDVSALPLLHEKVREAVGDELADKAFFGNAFRFLTTYLR